MFQGKTFVSALLAGALALPAFAQDANPPAEPAAQPAAQPAEGAQRTGIEEITITARKVSENLQQAPLAVSAFDSGMLESLGVENTNDVSALAPNLYLTQTPSSAANMALAIRGVGGAEPLLTREQGVAVYMDGAYIARVTGAITDLVDIERVEVLRGPQGTLYGRNATGGAVNFISRKPTEDFNMSASLGTGSFSRLNSRIGVNTGELLPGLAASMTYLHSQVDGYIDNPLTPDNQDPGAKNTDAFRVALGWDVTEKLRLDYAFDYSKLKGATPIFQLWEVGPTLAGAINISSLAAGSGPLTLLATHRRLDKLASNSVGPSKHRISGHNLTAEYDFGFAKLKSITTYRNWTNHEKGGDLDGNVLPPLLVLDPVTFAPSVVAGLDVFSADNERHQHQWTEELQLLGDFGDHFRYVAGFYYFKERYSEDNLQRLLFPFSPVNPVLNITTPFTYSGDARSWALYANATYTFPFLDDRLSLTAGIRYSKDDKSFSRSSFPATANSHSWNNVDWEGNLNFLATDNLTIYFRAASAYKAGGFNLRSSVAPVNPFDAEKLTSVEGGVKSEWLDHRVRLNVAGFWSLYKDLQTDVFAASASGATSLTVNAGEAVIPGIEGELLAVPIDGLTINANVGWIKPKYNEYNVINNNGTPADPSDDFVENLAHQAKFGYKPEVTATIGAEYATPALGSLGWVFTPRIDASYTASRVWSPLDDEAPRPVTTPFRDALKDGGYWLLNVRLTVSEIKITDRAKLKATVYGKNVTDSQYLLSGIDFGGLDFAGGIFGEPATWGIDFTFDY
jgi:iron complex outermembrane receptor protein